MSVRHRVAPAIAGLLLAATALEAGAQSLGRLFTTPEERAALDAAREQAAIARPEPGPDPEPAPNLASPAVEPRDPSLSRLTINGLVRRSGGPTTVWVNGDLLDRGGVSREGVAVDSARDDQGGVRLRLPSGAGTVALQPGQQIDIDSGTLLEPYQRRRSGSGARSAFEQPDTPAQREPAPARAAPGEAAAGRRADGAAQALAGVARPEDARSAEERAAIDSMRERVRESLSGSAPGKQ